MFETLNDVLLYMLYVAALIATPWIVHLRNRRAERKRQRSPEQVQSDVQRLLAMSDRRIQEGREERKRREKRLLEGQEGQRKMPNAEPPKLVDQPPKPPKKDKPTITISAGSPRNRKNPEMAESDFQEEKSLLEQYADATHDIEMLQVFLQNMLAEQNPAGLMLQQVVQRSIARAEAEAQQLKNRYEHNEER